MHRYENALEYRPVTVSGGELLSGFQAQGCGRMAGFRPVEDNPTVLYVARKEKIVCRISHIMENSSWMRRIEGLNYF